MANSFELSFVAIDLLAQVLRLDCRVYPFQFTSVGEYAEERSQILRSVRGDLERRGLATARGPAPAVVDALRLMSDHQVAIAVTGRAGGRDLYARATSNGERAVLAVRNGNGLVFTLLRPEALASAVAGLLPQANPGPGQSVTITRPGAPARLNEDRQGESIFGAPVRATHGASELQLQAVAQMLRRRRLGAGYVVVSGRDHAGRESKAPSLSWIDTDAGRYLARSTPSEYGPPTSTFFPVDQTRLTHQLNELIATVLPATVLPGRR